MDLKLILDAAVAIGTLSLAGFTWWLAKGTAVLAREAHASSHAADKLYDLQAEAMAREEHAARPNLQVIDIGRKLSTATGNPGVMPALVVELQNFGKRSMRIEKMELLLGDGSRKHAEQRSRPVIHASESVLVQIDKAINLALAGQIGTLFEPGYEVREDSQSTIDVALATTLTLVVTFSEVDGSGEKEQTIPLNAMAYRSGYRRTDFTYSVKSDQ